MLLNNKEDNISVEPLVSRRLEYLLSKTKTLESTKSSSVETNTTFTQTSEIELFDKEYVNVLEQELEDLKEKALKYKQIELNLINSNEMLKNKLDTVQKDCNDAISDKEEAISALSTVKSNLREANDSLAETAKQAEMWKKNSISLQDQVEQLKSKLAPFISSTGQPTLDKLLETDSLTKISAFLMPKDIISLKNSNKCLKKAISKDILFEIVKFYETKQQEEELKSGLRLKSYFDFKNEEAEIIVKKHLSAQKKQFPGLFVCLSTCQQYLDKAVFVQSDVKLEEDKEKTSSIFESTRSLFKKLRSGYAEDNYGYIKTNIKSVNLSILDSLFKTGELCEFNYSNAEDIFKALTQLHEGLESNEQVGLTFAIFKLFSDLLIASKEALKEAEEFVLVKKILFERFKRYYLESLQLEEVNKELQSFSDTNKQIMDSLVASKQNVQVKYNNCSLENSQLVSKNNVKL